MEMSPTIKQTIFDIHTKTSEIKQILDSDSLTTMKNDLIFELKKNYEAIESFKTAEFDNINRCIRDVNQNKMDLNKKIDDLMLSEKENFTTATEKITTDLKSSLETKFEELLKKQSDDLKKDMPEMFKETKTDVTSIKSAIETLNSENYKDELKNKFIESIASTDGPFLKNLLTALEHTITSKVETKIVETITNQMLQKLSILSDIKTVVDQIASERV
ncbi:hypothetical protein CCFV1_ORF093 [Cotesia congregata filamentous virus 1]|uniref:Uncharacterized protein n=1 Tax=Cotesia congregata filamentous virus 1 TaxID=3064291 RepID=A0ABC8QJR8_9VIRU|nr:hypothetical protein CCFV1_ORF093 [Cotesia congregata filamentous virus 1]